MHIRVISEGSCDNSILKLFNILLKFLQFFWAYISSFGEMFQTHSKYLTDNQHLNSNVQNVKSI